jgi:hypothetical protein
VGTDMIIDKRVAKKWKTSLIALMKSWGGSRSVWGGSFPCTPPLGLIPGCAQNFATLPTPKAMSGLNCPGRQVEETADCSDPLYRILQWL